MKNESVKKSLEKSKNVLQEKRKIVKRKICIKKHSRKNSGSDSKRPNFTNKTVIAAEATTFCIKTLTHLSRSALQIGETKTTVTQKNKMQQNFVLMKTFGNVKKPK